MRDAAKALDDVSDHMGEVLRQADALLAEWSGFAANIRMQVEQEARTIGDAVGGAIDVAISRGVDEAVARAMGDRLAGQLAQLANELTKIENRARAASRAVAEQRSTDKRVWWLLGGGIALANGLLVALLLRGPAPAPAPPPEPPAPIVVPNAQLIPADAPPLPAIGSDVVEVGSGSGSAIAPAKATKPIAAKPRTHR